MGFTSPGGHTMLKVGINLNDLFATLSVWALCSQMETIVTMEDRQLFAVVMEQIDEKCVQSNDRSLRLEHTVHTQSHLARVLHYRGTYDPNYFPCSSL